MLQVQAHGQNLKALVLISRYLYGSDQETKRVECWFSKDEVPDGWMVRYVVRPSNAFGVKGEAIATQFSLAGSDNPTL